MPSWVYAISTGENIGLASNTLAITITRTMTVVFTGRHFDKALPRLRREMELTVVRCLKSRVVDVTGSGNREAIAS
jgi:hypothetical protein